MLITEDRESSAALDPELLVNLGEEEAVADPCPARPTTSYLIHPSGDGQNRTTNLQTVLEATVPELRA